MNAPFSTPNGNLNAQEKWQGFHWTFFIDVQGLILSLLCFERALESQNLERADTELRCAAELLRASGAAMRLAGDFSPKEYEEQVRVSMMPPNLDLDNFSGLMSWEHSRLIRLWQKLSPSLGDLPQELTAAHSYFVTAFVEMIAAHRSVCQQLVGEEPSLRSCDPAVGVLEKLLVNRLRLIDPNENRRSGCPFSKEGSDQ